MEDCKSFIIVMTLIHLSLSDTNIVQVEGLHLTVKIYQDIPKHICSRTLANFEGIFYLIGTVLINIFLKFKIIYIVFLNFL